MRNSISQIQKHISTQGVNTRLLLDFLLMALKSYVYFKYELFIKPIHLEFRKQNLPQWISEPCALRCTNFNEDYSKVIEIMALMYLMVPHS